MIQTENNEILQKALLILSPLERLIVLAYADGKKFKEIAEDFAEEIESYGAKATKNTVESYWHMAIAKLVHDDRSEFSAKYAAQLDSIVNLHDINFSDNANEDFDQMWKIIPKPDVDEMEIATESKFA